MVKIGKLLDFTKKQPNLSVDENKQNNQKYVDDEIEKKPTISLSNSKLIQQARMSQKNDTKTISSKINIDSNIIQDYESGKTAPDYAVMCKIEKR